MEAGAPGQFVGDRYEIVRELGRGGMGVVYLARDTRLDMDVAIKFRGVSHADATLWLKREFRAVASLRHANLVELYELVAHERSCYFTMEYLPGLDPRRWVARTVTPYDDAPTLASMPMPVAPATDPDVFARPVPVVDFRRVRSVIGQLAEGLAFLHAHGVIHRDVKPSNVIVVDGAVKLLDFGLALERSRQAEDLARETRVVGTAAYLAPEYVEKLSASPWMDVYALGVLAYELCTGAPPFGGTLHVLSRMQQKVRVPRVSVTNPQIPPELDELIEVMLAMEPMQRPSAVEVATRLLGGGSRPVVRGRQRFVGRDAELARIAARIEDGAARARLVLLTGPSGAGKTAILDEVANRARGQAIPIWRGRCHERERLPYRAFDGIVDDLATELAIDPRHTDSLPHVAALARVFPVLGPLLDPARLDEPPAADLRVERERGLLGVSHLFGHVVSTARSAVVIDDLQWADPDSLELLAVLIETLDRPLTVVASWMTQGPIAVPPTELLARLGDAAEVIEVPPMDELELAELIAELAPGVPLQRVTTAAQLSAGSPYLAELIGRELADADVADPTDAETRRLARLSSDERAVAEVTAIAGGATTFEQLRAIAELSSRKLSSVLRRLEDARVIRAVPAASGDAVYVYYHQRLRETASAQLTSTGRRALHERFARWFEGAGGEPAQLAYHWQEAGDAAHAARWAIAAGDAARAQLAWTLAADWYARARSLGDTASATREKLADCLFLAGKLSAAADEFLALAGRRIEPPARPRWLRAAPIRPDAGDRWRVRAAEAYLKLGDLDRGLGVLDDVLARRGAPRAKHRGLSVMRAATVAARWLAPLGMRPRRDEVLPAAYRVIASFLSTPYPVESLEYVLRGVAHAEGSGDRAGHAMGMAMLSAYLATGSLGRFGDRAIANAHQLSAQSGAAYPQMVAAGASGMLATLRGNWSAMRHAHEEAERVCTRLGLERSWEASFLRSYWAMGELYAGEPARALELLAPMTDTSEDLWTRAMLGSCRGRVLVLAGDLDGARAVARDLAVAPAARQGLAAIYRQVFLGELALAEHAWLRARTIADELASAARAQWLSTMPAISAMIDVIAATAELGLATAGDRDAARRAQAIARRLHRRGSASFYAATALRIIAQAARLLGDPDSDVLLARACAVASERGGKVDQLALAVLGGESVEPGALAAAVTWSTGGMIREHAWHR